MSRPVEDYGVIGDTRTLAVVARNGDIDWCCWPRFDSPSIFGALLDPDAGRWSLRPASDEACEGRQLYLSGTNVLVTRFHADGGVVEVEDYMAMDSCGSLMRRVSCSRGSIEMVLRLAVRPDYGRAEVELEQTPAGVALNIGDGLALELSGPDSINLAIDGHDVVATFAIDEGQVALFRLGDPNSEHRPDPELTYDATVSYWNEWTERSTYRGRWREAVERSALALKLLTHGESGAVLAAGTTSVPEIVGGERNWDYRYVWIRDAAFTIYAFLELGHRDEADAFAAWLVRRLDECPPTDGDTAPLAPLYDIDGSSKIDEVELDHWQGYRNSRPVRVGNAASGQTQLDVFGELIDSLYLTDKHGDGLSLDTWTRVVELVTWVLDHWQDPGNGMWEARSDPQRYTSSLLMCWVAVERAMRMANHRGRPAPLEEWRAARDAMHAALLDEAWNEELGAFTQTLGGETIDASILLAPLVKFIPGSDSRWQSTLDVIEDRLAHGPLVDRYDHDVTDDGLDGNEGSFTICSFWYVEAMARAGRVSEARRLFDRLLTYATPTGLFSEEIGPDGRQLGNFPQAFTHLSLISAAVLLDELLDE